ncbi:hypothetical protein PS627_00058 [Pseudomonas fluorescens]|jgi:hypothetical protein|uniref:hypothetical protein n=1 Tax=Pseudomonas fluorescens TaxID=294 RepID=UPI001250DE66|nr:hypothetical protein [Pseudomonas fluorescens]CAG8863122.1 hypothetical protein PS627_00058 [Pseudomonas fluorescens]
MYDNPRHVKNNIHKVRLNHYSDAQLRRVASTLGLQPAVLGRELVEMGAELLGDPDVVSLATTLKCSTTALIQQLVTQGVQELKALLDEDTNRLRA